jgi:hypothetical protein
MITPRYSCSLWSKDLIAIEKDQKKRNSESSLISVKSLRNNFSSRSRERTSSSRSHHSDKTEDSEPIVSSGAPVLPISEENFENIKETLKLLNPASLVAPDSPVASNHELQPPHDWNTTVPPPINHPPPPHPRNHTADPYYNDHPPPPHQPSRDFDMRSKPYDGPPPPPHRHYDDRGWDRRGPPPPNDYYRDGKTFTVTIALLL